MRTCGGMIWGRDLTQRRKSAEMQLFHSSCIGRGASVILAVLVFALHCAVGFILYRGTVVHHWAICDSELIAFYAPLVFAFAVYAFILLSSSWLRPRSALRSFGLVGVSFVLVFLSTWCHMVLALNRYGS